VPEVVEEEREEDEDAGLERPRGPRRPLRVLMPR
jgi:hypothetical protein